MRDGKRTQITLLFVKLCFWHVRIVSFPGCWLQLNNMCCMAVLPIGLASLVYLTWETFIAHWILLFLVSVLCGYLCDAPWTTPARPLAVVHTKDFALWWPVVSPLARTVQKRRSQTFERRVFSKDPLGIFSLNLISEVHPTLRGIILSHSGLRMFRMLAWGTTKVAPGRTQPFFLTFVVLATVTAVQKREC